MTVGHMLNCCGTLLWSPVDGLGLSLALHAGAREPRRPCLAHNRTLSRTSQHSVAPPSLHPALRRPPPFSLLRCTSHELLSRCPNPSTLPLQLAQPNPKPHREHKHGSGRACASGADSGSGSTSTWATPDAQFEAQQLAPDDVDGIAAEVKACAELVQSVGRGFVFLGSSRVPEDHPFFVLSRDLSRQLALSFGSPAWSGVGPGLMEAVVQGAKQAGTKVGGFKVLVEATQSSAESYAHPHLSPQEYLICRSLLARKQGFLWAGSRMSPQDRAGFVALPGGVGTVDELLDLLALRQLRMLRSRYPVPLVLLNYDGCYNGLLDSFKDMERLDMLRPGELEGLWFVCSTNEEALETLRTFFQKNS